MKAILGIVLALVFVFGIFVVRTYSLSITDLISNVLEGDRVAKYRLHHDCSFSKSELAEGLSYLTSNSLAEEVPPSMYLPMIDMFFKCGLNPSFHYQAGLNPIDKAILSGEYIMTKRFSEYGMAPTSQVCEIVSNDQEQMFSPSLKKLVYSLCSTSIQIPETGKLPK